MKIFLQIILVILFLSAPLSVLGFNHHHTGWNRLVKKHVYWINNGTASQVDYSGFQKDRPSLRLYLNSLSSVSLQEFNSWTKKQQLAFLINAYNAFTIELILTKYPYIKSIKDIGSLFQTPWKKKFFTMFDKRRHLDWLEHNMMRKPGKYNEPRIHTSINCASIGCPGLRNKAFTAATLNADLEDNLQRFLKDKTRNRYNNKTGKLEVSQLFAWYGKDFIKSYNNLNSLQDLFAQYAGLLADKPKNQVKIKNKRVRIQFLDYNWNLNKITPEQAFHK